MSALAVPVITPANWDIADRYEVNGRKVDTDTELSIRGERGRFRFLQFVMTDKGSCWIDVYGGRPGHETVRSFHPEKVKTVHRKTKMRAGGVQK